MPGIVVGELCPSCQRFRSPREMLQHTGFRHCLPCEQRHLEALHSLSTGTPPRECSECGKKWEELRQGEPLVKMYCHMENGLYRFLCKDCDKIYTPKRRELYGPTEFGHTSKLN
jgi:hypothetical protein